MKKQSTKFFPAEIKKIGKVTYIDLTKPGAYLPKEMYHSEDDIYDEEEEIKVTKITS